MRELTLGEILRVSAGATTDKQELMVSSTSASLCGALLLAFFSFKINGQSFGEGLLRGVLFIAAGALGGGILGSLIFSEKQKLSDNNAVVPAIPTSGPTIYTED